MLVLKERKELRGEKLTDHSLTRKEEIDHKRPREKLIYQEQTCRMSSSAVALL